MERASLGLIFMPLGGAAQPCTLKEKFGVELVISIDICSMYCFLRERGHLGGNVSNFSKSLSHSVTFSFFVIQQNWKLYSDL